MSFDNDGSSMTCAVVHNNITYIMSFLSGYDYNYITNSRENKFLHAPLFAIVEKHHLQSDKE